MSDATTSLSSIVASLAGTIGHEMFPRGDLAELRRLRPTSPPPAYWRLLFDRVPEDWRQGERQERAWAVIMAGMAAMAPAIHSPQTSLGAAMARIGGSTAENRLWKLLRLRGESLEDHLLMLTRFLATKEASCNWIDLARLLLSADEGKRDKVCHKLARDFYKDRTRPQPSTPNA